MTRLLSVSVLCLVVLPPSLSAHEVRPAYLELTEIGAETYEVLWTVPARGEDQRLALYVEFPPGSTNVTAPRRSLVNHAFTERWTVRREGGLAGGVIHIAGLAATLTDVLVRVQRLDGSTQVTRLTPAAPSFMVAAAPRATEVAGTYLRLGVEHILLGIDHLLFVLALLILVEGTRRLVMTITAFTLAHSLTLAGATLGFVHVPGPPVEAAIALSIMFVAAEIVHGRHGTVGLTRCPATSPPVPKRIRAKHSCRKPGLLPTAVEEVTANQHENIDDNGPAASRSMPSGDRIWSNGRPWAGRPASQVLALSEADIPESRPFR
jgi:hypothetical protein